MQITRNYQGKAFGDFVKDMFENNTHFVIPFMKWEDNSEVVIFKNQDYFDADMLRWYLKIFDIKYPKHDNGEPYSFAEIDSKTLSEHLDYYRLVLAHNGTCFKSDDEEWKRIIKGAY